MPLFWFTDPRSGFARAERALSKAQSSANAAEDALLQSRRLEARVNQLTLVNMALWSLLQEKTGLTEEDLLERVREIDLRDGVLDGRVSEDVAQCPECARTLSKRHDRCLYCGYEGATDVFGHPAAKL